MTKKIAKLLAGVALLSLVACTDKGEKTNMSLGNMSIENAQMAPVENPYAKGMVAAANPHAVDAGVEVLRKGGSAVDAAIAIQTTLGLVEPQSSGLGGGAFMVFYNASNGKVTAYNGRETAPGAVDENLFMNADGTPMQFLDRVLSGKSTGVPGAMAMLHLAHADHGKLPWADSFDYATKLADTGFVISPRLAGLIPIGGERGLKRQKAAYNYLFHEDGSPYTAGELRDNKPYAKTLRAIAKNWRALYEGPIAEHIIADIHDNPVPGLLSLEDMKSYKAEKMEALCSPYRDYILCGAQPPSSGGVAVQSIMGQIANFDMKTLGQSLEGWHVFAEASALAYADRDLYVADPEFVDVPTRALLTPNYLKSRAHLITMNSVLKDVKAGDPVHFKPGKDATPNKKDTSHFVVVDKWGNVVSMTTTVESLFGSERMVDGFFLNNQLTDFSFRPRDEDGNPAANRPGPHKRPRSSMAPHIVFSQDGQFSFATGSPGGSSIIAYTAKTIIGMIDWGLTPQEAIDLPNFISRNGAIRLEESRFDPKIANGLETMGHKVIREKGEISGLHIIRRKPDGSYEGGADPRREGKAESE